MPIDDPIGITGKPLNAVTYADKDVIDRARKPAFSVNKPADFFYEEI